MNASTAALLAGLVLLFPLAGSALCGLLGPVLGNEFPFATLFFAVLLTAWYGGRQAALTAVRHGIVLLE